MTRPTAAPDQAERDRIVGELEATLFVDAGAGSGKTSALVDRVVALVESGAVELREVAAITFTDKAGDELRDRLRTELEARAAGGGPHAEQCRLAVDQLDGAAIGTLHSFAQRLLTEHPIEAGLPPRIEVLDEVSSDVAFAERWSRFQDQLLSDESLEQTLLLLLAAGVRAEALRALARAFDDNWDLVESHVVASPGPVPSARDLLAAELHGARSLASDPAGGATAALRAKLDEITGWVDRLASLHDDVELLEALDPKAEPRPPSGKLGAVGGRNAGADVDALKARAQRLCERVLDIRSQVAQACARELAAVVRTFTLDAADERRRAGELQFHDLLVMARSLLVDPTHGPVVRRRLHERYRRILLDEFQDTDPIQVELAVRIAAADPASPEAGSAPWQEVELSPGHLFVVGDPKQSIYRFRRADISTFLAAADRFGHGTGGMVRLTANFRTTEPILQWVNGTFARLMGEAPDVTLPVASQPEYLALEPTRQGAPGGPAVSVVGRMAHPKETRADALRALEALDVAAAVATCLSEQWAVMDRSGEWRPARLGDVAILVPARTSLPFLEDALEDAGIPFRAESSSLVYATRAVRDLLVVLRAVDDPTDQLAVVSALRSALFGCGDDDLFRFRVQRRGHFAYLGRQPPSVPEDDPVAAGLEWLRALHEDRHWLAPSELLDRIARGRRALELGFAEGRPRDVWRRIRFVVDQARAWSEATGGNLREYLSWVRLQAAEGARVSEAVLPETDDDAVRIMTIHSAKGLEFPIVIASGLSTVPGGPRGSVEVAFRPDGTVGYKFGRHLTTPEYEEYVPVDEQMGLHERMRLLYVACTRARDHLVVSLHRKEANKPAPARRTNAELLIDGMGPELVAALPDAARAPGSVARPPVAHAGALPEFALWSAEREEALARAARRSAVAATALTDEGQLDVEEEPDAGLDKRPRDLDLPPWLKGRYGSAVGRAVHGVLQTIDLASGAGLDAAVAAQCEAEAVLERAEAVADLVRFALGAPCVRTAATAPHWRELYVCTPVHGRLLEGYVDLLYRSEEGLVVVDFKTAATDDPDELSRRVEGYRTQGASYALALSQASGEPVRRVVFLFLTPSGAVERELADLPAETRRVEELVRLGTETVVP